MRVIHPGYHVWTLKRRFAPWKRVVQPMNIASGEYRRYRALPADPRRKPSEWRQERRAQRKAAREEKLGKRKIRGWQWLYLGPLLLVAFAVLGIVGYVIEAIVATAQFLVWLVLVPFALLEMLAQLVCGLVLAGLRLVGATRSRVDVVCRVSDEQIVSLTVLSVRGFGAADHVARALADHLQKAQRPFDPYRDAVVVALLNRTGTHVVRHDSVWAPLRH